MARIRTIKPEFWQNEALANISLHAKLLAIALLNHADDGGYFLANAALVRAACFPFDDNSKNVLGSIQELSSIGYIEVRNCGEKQIGKIVKFKEHQRIDKPQTSKFADTFASFPKENDDSKNIPGTFQESSENVPRLEQGTGNREQGNGKGMEEEQIVFSLSENKKADKIEKPDGVDEQYWKDWLKVRKAKRCGPLTQTALDAVVREAAKSGKPLNEVIALCAEKGWKSFNASWVESDATGSAPRGSPQTFAQMRVSNTKSAIERFAANG